jgi:hypothetical protein
LSLDLTGAPYERALTVSQFAYLANNAVVEDCIQAVFNCKPYREVVDSEDKTSLSITYYLLGAPVVALKSDITAPQGQQETIVVRGSRALRTAINNSLVGV